MFNFFSRRRLFRTIYSLVTCVIIIVYASISQREMVNNVNSSIKTAMENSGEIDSTPTVNDIISDIDQPTLEILSKGIYQNRYKAGKKFVLYSGNNKVIELYEQNPDWTKKFEFIKVKTSELEGAYSAIKKPCKGICVIDFEKKKLYSIPKNKTNDNTYIYEVLSKCYY